MQLQHSNKTINQRKEAGMVTYSLREFGKFIDERRDRKWVKDGYIFYYYFTIPYLGLGAKPEDFTIEIPSKGGSTTIIYQTETGNIIKHKLAWYTNRLTVTTQFKGDKVRVYHEPRH